MVEAFFDELADGVCISDARGKVLYLNSAAERLLDTTASRCRGKTMCEILCGHLSVDGASECASACALLKPGSDSEAVTFQGSFGPKEVASWKDFTIQRRSVWKHLRVRCLKASASVVGAGKHLTLIEDATAEAELERQKEDWRQMIAHDLRSPLTAIYGAIRIFQDAGAAPPPGGAALAAAAERSCRRMLDLITLYLDVAKLDAGACEVRLGPVPLAELLRTEIGAQAATARGKELEVALSVPDEVVVTADAELLARVAQNLLDNAVKFTPLGGRVELSARADGAWVELSVKDSGIGIAPEELPRLFDRYHQARARREGKIKGTGLGLTFCREALRRMGATIDADSGPGRGATFVVRLPAAAR